MQNEDGIVISDSPVATWRGQSEHVRTMSGDMQDHAELLRYKLDAAGRIVFDENDKPVFDNTNLRAKQVRCVVCDKDGNYLYADKDIPALGRRAATTLDAIIRASRDLNPVTPDAIADVAKNS